MNFLHSDTIEISSSIVSKKGLINIKKFKWLLLSKKKIESTSFHMKNIIHQDFNLIGRNTSKHSQIQKIDLNYYCEFELMKSKWKPILLETTNISLDKHKSVLINSIKHMFEPVFSIENVYYDDVGYLLYKIILKAVKIGRNSNPKDLGITVEVKSETEISNEVKKNCVLFDRRNSVHVRVGDYFVLYVSKSK